MVAMIGNLNRGFMVTKLIALKSQFYCKNRKFIFCSELKE